VFALSVDVRRRRSVPLIAVQVKWLGFHPKIPPPAIVSVEYTINDYFLALIDTEKSPEIIFIPGDKFIYSIES